ncbi:MAG: SurA N-terminal domain-containing protein [Chloroflexi bacterium]|nr:SurA N-terminal domain-containing protein [Chloroflexota bacterium]
MIKQKLLFIHIAVWGILALGLVGCGDEPTPTAAVPTTAATAVIPSESTLTSPVVENVATAAPTPLPTPTTEPLAALVNNQPITLADFEQELGRYEQAQAALGRTPEENYRQIVLDALVEQAVIEQAAQAQGLSVTEEMVAAKVAELREIAGSEENFQSWLAANQFSEADFTASLAAEMRTEQLVAAVTANVPSAVPQVRARYLQVNDLALAQTILADIQAGGDFATLAQIHSQDRFTAESGGDLGFFAPGSLLVPQVEEAAFTLALGQTSDLITVTNSDGQTTYYLVQLIERDEARPLDPDQRSRLLAETFESWLANQLAQAQIEKYIDG